MSRLDVDIVSPDRRLWSGPARTVTAPAHDGEVGILPGHQPLLASLRPGKVRVQPVEGKIDPVEVSGGFISVDADRVTVVVELPRTE